MAVTTREDKQVKGCYSEEEVKAFMSTAAKGDAAAQYNLGWCYENGWGVAKDIAQAYLWYQRSAEHGNVAAQFALWRNAAAQCNLGVYYEHGWGVAKDIAQAFQWYQRSAELGDSWGQNNLGWCYERGAGVPKDEKMAVECYRKATTQNNAFAFYNLGYCYERGVGIAQDRVEAEKCYHEGAELGLERSVWEKARQEDQETDAKKIEEVKGMEQTLMRSHLAEVTALKETVRKLQEEKEALEQESTWLAQMMTSEGLQSLISLDQVMILNHIFKAKRRASYPVRNLSFVHLIDRLEEHKTLLNSQGALLTLEDLEREIARCLAHPPRDVFELQMLKQIIAGMTAFITSWRQNTLANRTAQATLDDRAIERLHFQYKAPERAMAEGKVEEVKRLSSGLEKRIEAHLEQQKEMVYQAWHQAKFPETKAEGGPMAEAPPSITVPLDIKACDVRIVETIWGNQWFLDPEHGLYYYLHANKFRAVEQLWRENKLPEEARTALTGALKQELLNLTIDRSPLGPRHNENSPLRPLYNLLQRSFGELARTARDKKPLQLQHEVAEQLLKCWQAGEIAESYILLCLQQLASKFDYATLLKGDLHTQVLRRTVEQLFEDYTSRKINSENDPIDHLNIEQAIRDVMVFRFKETPEQERAAMRDLLDQWKARRLSEVEQEEISGLILADWCERQVGLNAQLKELFRSTKQELPKAEAIATIKEESKDEVRVAQVIDLSSAVASQLLVGIIAPAKQTAGAGATLAPARFR